VLVGAVGELVALVPVADVAGERQRPPAGRLDLLASALQLSSLRLAMTTSAPALD